MELAVQPAVLDRGRHLTRDGREQREILAVERLVTFLPAERERGDRAALEDAGHEVVNARVAPRLDLLGREPRGGDRIVERHGAAGIEARDERRGARERRHGLAEAEVADRHEVARPLVGHHQRHAIDDQRLDDARDEALAEAQEVEVAVEVAREPDERPAIVVAVAVEDPVERVLHRVPHRARQQHDHDGGERRDDPVVLVGIAEQERDQLAERDEQRVRRAAEGRICEPALDDDFDVAEAVPHQRAGERERHEAERDRRQLQRHRGIQAERPRQRVAACEGARAERRPPGDPAQLAPRGQRRDLVEGAHQHRERGGRREEEIQRLGPIQPAERPDEHGAVAGRAARDHRDARRAEREAREVDQREQQPERAPVGPLGKDQREMQQQRRQQRHRHGISPVEHPVEPIERADERKREGAEERHAQPEEMQRGLIARPAEAHERAHEQGEQPDAREHEVHRARGRRRLEGNVEDLARAEPRQRVGELGARLARVLRLEDVAPRLDRRSVDREQHVARRHAGPLGRRSRRHRHRDHAFAVIGPEHAVLHRVPARLQPDVREAKRHEHRHDGQRERRSPPDEPAALGGNPA